MIETPNWNQDKFGAYQEEGNRFYKHRVDGLLDLKPIDNEIIEGYTRRIANKLKQLEDVAMEAHVYGRKMWYTHKQPRCFICDLISSVWLLYEQYNMICQALPENGRQHIFRAKGDNFTIQPLEQQ